MLQESVFSASREGDLPGLKRLVEVVGQDINVNDVWDATPLYYAALCGHEDVVKYLLERGARCEPNTFDGERCFYAALTDSIRRVLHVYQAANKQRGPLFVFTFRIFNNPGGGRPDLTLTTVDGWALHVHRFLLAARSSFFRGKLDLAWKDRPEVHLTDVRLAGPVLHAILSWLYTERLLCPVARLHSVLLLARNCRLSCLSSFLSTFHPASGEDGDRVVALDLGVPYRVGSVPVKLTPLPLAPHRLVPVTDPCIRADDEDNEDEEEGQGGNGVSPSSSLRSQVWHHILHPRHGCGVITPSALDPRWQGEWEGEVEEWEDMNSSANQVHADCVVMLDGTGISFPAHTAVLAGRSKYIESMLDFEAQTKGHEGDKRAHALRRIVLYDASPPAVATCIEWLYCDSVRPLAPRVCLEALALADRLLLTDMRAPLVTHIIKQLCTATITDAWRLGEQMSLQKLSESCAMYAAKHLDSVLAMPDMVDLARESAAGITHRQEFDSVPVLDEIKAAIRSMFGGAASGEVPPGNEDMRVTVLAAGLSIGGMEGRGRVKAEVFPLDDEAVPLDDGEWDPEASARGLTNGFKSPFDGLAMNPQSGGFSYLGSHLPASYDAHAEKEGAKGVQQVERSEEFQRKIALVDAFATLLGFKTRR